MNSAPHSTISPAALKKARMSHITALTGLRDDTVIAPDTITTVANR